VRRIRRERPDGGAFVDTAEWWAERLVKRTIVGFVVNEGMNHADHREAWAGSGIGYRSPATIAVPAEDLLGEAYAPQGVHTRDEFHAVGRHLEDVRSARRVEDVRSLEEACENLTVLAIADEPEAT